MNSNGPQIKLDRAPEQQAQFGVDRLESVKRSSVPAGIHEPGLLSASLSHVNNSLLEGSGVRRSASTGEALNQLMLMESSQQREHPRGLPVRADSMANPLFHDKRAHSLTEDCSLSSSLGVFSTARSSRLVRHKTVDTPTINKFEGEEFDMVNQYKVLDIIGHGAYGIVHKVTDSNEITYAMKIVGKRRMRRKSLFPGKGSRGAQKDPLEGIRKEIAILKKLTHPNVVKLMEVLDDPQEDELILVFEYIPNGPVMPSISPEHMMSEHIARHHFINLILGLEYLHAHKVIHRDIKPENLLLDHHNNLKIADFGVSEQWTSDSSDVQLRKSAGTPAFTAPEALDPFNPEFSGRGLDIFAAGVTLYCFVFGKVPFAGKGIADLHEKIRHKQVEFPDDVPVSSDLQDLLCCLLEKDPKQRISIRNIRQHLWITAAAQPLPSPEENCQDEIDVTDEEVEHAVKCIQTPIHILVMIKNMAQRKSLRNPYNVGITRSPSTSPANSRTNSIEAQDKRMLFAKRSSEAVIDEELSQ